MIKYLVWNVDKGRPISEPLKFKEAMRLAEAREQRHPDRHYTLVPA